MFYVNPAVKPHFDSLSPELQQAISEKNITLNSLNDLIKVLEEIVEEEEN